MSSDEEIYAGDEFVRRMKQVSKVKERSVQAVALRNLPLILSTLNNKFSKLPESTKIAFSNRLLQWFSTIVFNSSTSSQSTVQILNALEVLPALPFNELAKLRTRRYLEDLL